MAEATAPLADTLPFDPFDVSTNRETTVKTAHHNGFTDFQQIVKNAETTVNNGESVTPPSSENEAVKVSPKWKGKEIENFRKRVYGWWHKAHFAKKASTRKDNANKSRKAFAWFKEHGCTVTITAPGKVCIEFPKS